MDKQDYNVRRAAFDWLERRVLLLGPQGIFKPRVLDIPIPA